MNQTGSFQARVAPWLDATFGPEISGDREERNHRFLEEAFELVQANGCTASEAHQLVDYVFGRPVGEPSQEVGGVMVTLAALCLASGLDMHEAAETELTRVWTKVEQIRAKQAAKPMHSPLAEATAPPSDASGYQLAFYELAGLMKIGAPSQAPGHVWRTEMLPRLLAAFGTNPAEPSALAASIADLEAFEREGMMLDWIENWASFGESVALCLHELKRLRVEPCAAEQRFQLYKSQCEVRDGRWRITIDAGEDPCLVRVIHREHGDYYDWPEDVGTAGVCPAGDRAYTMQEETRYPTRSSAMKAAHDFLRRYGAGEVEYLEFDSDRQRMVVVGHSKRGLMRGWYGHDADKPDPLAPFYPSLAVSSAAVAALLEDPVIAAAVNERGGGRSA